MIKNFDQFVNEMLDKENIKEAYSFPNTPIQSAGKGEKDKINVVKTVKEAILAIKRDGGFYFFVGQVLKNNKTNPKTDELLTRMTNDVVSGVEKELGVKLHAGIIHLGKPLYDGSVNQYQYFYVKD